MSIPNADTNLLGSLIRLYQAGYGHQPDNAGLEYWYAEASAGATLGKIGGDFVLEAGFDAVAKDAFIVLLYANVLGRVPDQAGLDYWNASTLTYGEILASFANSTEYMGRVAMGVSSVTQKAISGDFIDPTADLIGTPVFKLPEPVEVIKEVVVSVPTPTPEAHTITFDDDGTVSTLGQKLDGTMLFGTGNVATSWQLVTDTETNVEFGLNVVYRQSATEIAPTSSSVSGSHAVANYTADAGTQDGDHGAPVNANRSAVSVNFVINGGPGALGQDGTHQWLIDWEGADGLVRTTALEFGPGGQHLWRDTGTNAIVIADDPVNAYSAQNSQNFAFPVLGSTANVLPGEYTVTIREVSLVGLDAGQTVASLSANINLV
jgi:hypothetical protein